MKRFLYAFLSLFIFCAASAQDVSGFWKGSLTFSGGCFAQNNIELQLSLRGDLVFGSSYHYLDTKNYIRKDADGIWDERNKKLIVREGLVTEHLVADRCQICVKKFTFIYRKEGDKEYLDGFWTGKIQNTDDDCGTGGTITLSRIAVPVFKEDLVPEVKVDTGDIILNFYDNGTVDGDSITVLVNNKPVLSHQLLSLKPNTTTVKVSLANPFIVVEMRAENLGSIPPNTAMLEVIAGTVYERLFLTSTEEKSAKIRFVYDKSLSKPPPPDKVGF